MMDWTYDAALSDKRSAWKSGCSFDDATKKNVAVFFS